MGFFGSSNKKEGPSGGSQPASPKEIARFGGLLSEMVVQGLTNDKGKVIPEDALALSATICAERCIDAAGDLPLRDHELVPGSRFNSEKIDTLLFGASGDGSWQALPPASAFGYLRDRLLSQGFQLADLPDLKGVIQNFNRSADAPEYFGTVPLTIPKEKFPSLSPLKIGYESRRDVDDRLRPLSDRLDRVAASLWGLMEVMIFSRQGMAPPLVLRLTVEVIYGMAHTAPMTARRADEMKRMGQ